MVKPSQKRTSRYKSPVSNPQSAAKSVEIYKHFNPSKTHLLSRKPCVYKESDFPTVIPSELELANVDFHGPRQQGGSAENSFKDAALRDRTRPGKNPKLKSNTDTNLNVCNALRLMENRIKTNLENLKKRESLIHPKLGRPDTCNIKKDATIRRPLSLDRKLDDERDVRIPLQFKKNDGATKAGKTTSSLLYDVDEFMHLNSAHRLYRNYMYKARGVEEGETTKQGLSASSSEAQRSSQLRSSITSSCPKKPKTKNDNISADEDGQKENNENKDVGSIIFEVCNTLSLQNQIDCDLEQSISNTKRIYKKLTAENEATNCVPTNPQVKASEEDIKVRLKELQQELRKDKLHKTEDCNHANDEAHQEVRESKSKLEKSSSFQKVKEAVLVKQVVSKTSARECRSSKELAPQSNVGSTSDATGKTVQSESVQTSSTNTCLLLPDVVALRNELDTTKQTCHEEIKNSVKELRSEIAQYRQALNINVNILSGKLLPESISGLHLPEETTQGQEKDILKVKKIKDEREATNNSGTTHPDHKFSETDIHVSSQIGKTGSDLLDVDRTVKKSQSVQVINHNKEFSEIDDDLSNVKDTSTGSEKSELPSYRETKQIMTTSVLRTRNSAILTEQVSKQPTNKKNRSKQLSYQEAKTESKAKAEGILPVLMNDVNFDFMEKEKCGDDLTNNLQNVLDILKLSFQLQTQIDENKRFPNVPNYDTQNIDQDDLDEVIYNLNGLKKSVGLEQEVTEVGNDGKLIEVKSNSVYGIKSQLIVPSTSDQQNEVNETEKTRHATCCEDVKKNMNLLMQELQQSKEEHRNEMKKTAEMIKQEFNHYKQMVDDNRESPQKESRNTKPSDRTQKEAEKTSENKRTSSSSDKKVRLSLDSADPNPRKGKCGCKGPFVEVCACREKGGEAAERGEKKGEEEKRCRLFGCASYNDDVQQKEKKRDGEVVHSGSIVNAKARTEPPGGPGGVPLVVSATMEVEELVCVALLARRLCCRRRKRKWLAQPYSNDRMLAGRFSAMFADLKSDEGRFLEYFRMSIASFDELLHYLRSSLQRENTKMRLSVPPDQRLAVTLRYLATGATFSSLHNEFELGISTVSCIVKDTCQSLWICMKCQCLPALKEEDWHEIEANFRKNTNFPHCIGALDEKHIRTHKPSENRLMIMLTVMADAGFRLRAIDVRLDGETNETSVFKECGLGIKLDLEKLKIPKPEILPDDASNLKAPFVFVGDEAFNLSPNMLRPYSSRGLSTTKKIFNYRLKRARRVVECAIGILTNRWQIFAKPVNVSAEFAKDILKACCLLHNFVIQRDGYKFEDTLVINGFEDSPNKSGRGGRIGLAVRDQFAEYFSGASGSVPWQDSCILDD